VNCCVNRSPESTRRLLLTTEIMHVSIAVLWHGIRGIVSVTTGGAVRCYAIFDTVNRSRNRGLKHRGSAAAKTAGFEELIGPT